MRHMVSLPRPFRSPFFYEMISDFCHFESYFKTRTILHFDSENPEWLKRKKRLGADLNRFTFPAAADLALFLQNTDRSDLHLVL